MTSIYPFSFLIEATDRANWQASHHALWKCMVEPSTACTISGEWVIISHLELIGMFQATRPCQPYYSNQSENATHDTTLYNQRGHYHRGKSPTMGNSPLAPNKNFLADLCFDTGHVA